MVAHVTKVFHNDMGFTVSVCIPAYRAKNFISDALQSVKSQTFQNWELIVVEDGSDDGTQELVEEFSKQVEQRVHYHRHENNRGLSNTRNTGFSYAQGKWIAILDADDRWQSEHLNGLLQTVENTKADLVFSSSRVFDSDSDDTLYIRQAPEGLIENIGVKLFDGAIIIQPSSVIFKKELLNTLGGFNDAFPICNDLDFWLRAAKAGFRFAGVSATTCEYRKHSNAMSRKNAVLIQDAARVRAQLSDWRKLPILKRIFAPAKQLIDAARITYRAAPCVAVGYLAETVSMTARCTVNVIRSRNR